MVIAAPTLNFKSKQATLPVKSFLQRLLLVTNGRISDIIRAYSGEGIKAIKLYQKSVTFSSSNSSLAALQQSGKQELIESSTVLQGQDTKTNYLHANSYLIPKRLEPKIRGEFIFNRQPIDKLLENNRVETYREIIDCGIEPAGSLAECFGVEAETKIIYRTYLVLIKSLPTMQITERFPISHFID